MEKQKEIKSFPAIITSVDAVNGIVESIVAVTGNVDKGNDKIWLGAFTKTLTENFKRIRVLDNHNANSVTDIVGKPLEIRELKRYELPEKLLLESPNATGGLFTKTQYALNTSRGFDTFNLLKEGFITEYSIGFVIPKGKSDMTYENINGTKTPIRNIREISLYEYSPVIWAMGNGTQTMNVMSEKFNLATKESINNLVYRLRRAFEEKYMITTSEGDYTYSYPQYYVNDVFSDYITVCPAYGSEMEYPFYRVNYVYENDTFRFDEITEWIGGAYQFVVGTKSFEVNLDVKAGKVLSASNRTLVSNAAVALAELLAISEDKEELDTVDDNSNNVSEEKSEESLAEPDKPFTNPQDLEIQKQRILKQIQLKRIRTNA